MQIETVHILIDAAKHVQSVYINNVWTTMGALLVALGWLLTSKASQGYLSGHTALRRSCIGVTVLIFLIHSMVLIAAHVESQLIMDEVQLENQPTLELVFSIYEIPWHWPLISLIINGLITYLLLFKLISLRVASKSISR